MSILKGHSDNKNSQTDNPSTINPEYTEAPLFSSEENDGTAVTEPGETESTVYPLTEDEVILPPEPKLDPLVSGMVNGVSYWGFSQRGESHIQKNAPCQDRCLIDVVDENIPIIVAAIADGVGSCALSHYGAARATRSAVDCLKKELISCGKRLDDAFVGDLLRKAMNCAYEAVHNEAEEMEQLEYSFQSTLTLAIYDGFTLYFAHAGDDGIVAVLNDGKMDLVTVRKKGEEASSVVPLQSLDWEVRKTTNVNAFIMATDGVLDAFVKGEMEGNRIYYPFVENAIQPGQSSGIEVKEVAEFYYNFMAGQEYRSSVTDDLTLVVITNQNRISEENLPEFDLEEWNRYTAEREAQIKAALYPAEKTQKKKTAVIKCRYCGREITDKNADRCPACGRSVKRHNPVSPSRSAVPDGHPDQGTSDDRIKVPDITHGRPGNNTERVSTRRNSTKKVPHDSDRKTGTPKDMPDQYEEPPKSWVDVLIFILVALTIFLAVVLLITIILFFIRFRF